MFDSLDLVYEYPFTSKRESHSVPEMDFLITPSLILSQLEVIKDRVTKTNYKAV